MEKISFFLEKFKTLGLDRNLATGAFIETVFKVLGVKLPPESVTLKEDTFFVRAHPALKSELYLKREAILSELSKLPLALKDRKIR